MMAENPTTANPMVSTTPAPDGPEFDGSGNGAVPAPPAPVDVPAWRLISTLAVAGALAGLLIVLVYQWAEPRIEAHQAEVLRGAIQVVLNGPDHYQTLYVNGDHLSDQPPAGVDPKKAEAVYLGFDANNQPIGFAVPGAEPGFQDIISLIFGYQPATSQLLGMTVMDDKETPGLGDKISSDPSFAAGFKGALGPIVGVKKGAETGDKHEVDMITGATISSRAVIGIINHRIERFGPLLQAYWKEHVQ